MGRMTTHVLDTAHGRPGAGMRVRLYRRRGADYALVKEVTTNGDGRCDGPLLEADAFTSGAYRLVFSARTYFAALGVRWRLVVAGGFPGGRVDVLEQRPVVVTHAVHPWRNRVESHRGGRVGRDQIGDIGARRVEPSRIVLGRHDERHPVVDRMHERIRFRRHDRAGVEDTVVIAAPALVESRQAEERAVKE